MEEAGAEPAGRVSAVNSGTASLPTSLPGWCCGGVRGEVRGGKRYWAYAALEQWLAAGCGGVEFAVLGGFGGGVEAHGVWGRGCEVVRL